MTETLQTALAQAWESSKTLNFYDFSGLSQSVPFSEFGKLVTQYGRDLRACGVTSQSVVAVMGPTSLDLTVACAAVWSIGATLTVLPTPTRLGNLEQYLSETLEKLQRSQASLLIGDEAAVAIFKEMTRIPVLSWHELTAQSSGFELRPADLGGLHPALIQFSSGTTRAPQPILLSEQALLHNARAVLDCFPGGASTHSCVSWLPLYHDMGLIGCFLMPLLAPGDLSLMGPEVFAVRPMTWLEAISEQRATTSSAPNFALAYCAERLTDEEIAKLDLSSWQISMVGAEAVRPRTLRRFCERFEKVGFQPQAFSPVYGLAEATLAVTFSPLGQGLHTYSYDAQELASTGRVVSGEQESPSLGQPLDGVSVEIRKGSKVLPEGQLGEVWVKSPSLSLGTLVDGQVVPFESDWLETGDAGFLLEGNLYLYGRRRDILLLDGRNHDPGLLEEAAEGLACLRRCCAFVQEVTGGDKDRLVLLCEVANSWQGDTGALTDEITQACRQGATLVPDTVVLLKNGELPVTSSGKLRRAVAAQMFQEGQLTLLQVARV